jgi:hypothetical protein
MGDHPHSGPFGRFTLNGGDVVVIAGLGTSAALAQP